MTFFFFFQAEDGIRDAQESRGLGDVYKRQLTVANGGTGLSSTPTNGQLLIGNGTNYTLATLTLSLIHI